MRAGDMDNDSDLDIVAGGGGALFVYQDDGAGGSWARFGNLDSTGQSGSNGAVLFDVDGDGDLDVVGATYLDDLGWWDNPGGPLSQTLWTFRRFAGGNDGWFLHDMIVTDLDHDGVAEEFIAVLQRRYWNAPFHVSWFRPGADPTADWLKNVITENQPGPNNNHAGIDAADVDGDGDIDVSFSNGWFESSTGAGPTWVWHAVADLYGISNSLIRDMDGDLDMDLVMSAGHHGQGVYWFENNGDPQQGGWVRHNISAVIGDPSARHFFASNAPEHVHHPEGLRVMDLDGDHDLDVIVSELFFGEDPGEPLWSQTAHNLYVFHNTGGTPPSWDRQNIAPDSYPSHKLKLADINGDGAPDFISEGSGAPIVTYHRNTTTTVAVELRAVDTGNPTVPEEGALPAGIGALCPGRDFFVEVWVSQVNGGIDGIIGGSVDLLFDTATVTATSVDHGTVFDTLPNLDLIDNTAGLIDDLGGATTLAGKAVGPNWALLARVAVTGTGSGPCPFSLDHGGLAFALAGAMPPLANTAVDVSATLTLNAAVVDDGVACTTDACDAVTGVVLHTPNDANCANGLFCDGSETCDVTLDCQVGTAPALSDGVACTDDTCDEVNDLVVNTPNDANCDNGLFCDGSETCDALLDCQAGSDPCEDFVGCTVDSCAEATECVNTPTDSLCDNGLFCDGAEFCDPLLDCQTGADPCEDFVGCTVDSCAEATDTCINTPTNSLCDNGLFCDGAETCDAVTDCQPGFFPCDDSVGCTDDSCHDVLDTCTNAVNDANCDNGLFCDGAETCNVTLGCQVGTAPTLSDGVVCTDDACDEINDVVVHAPNDALCNDTNICTTDVCDVVLSCVNSALIYDLDETNFVDFSDFALFAPHFASFSGDLAYNPCADFYFDAVIDAADVSFLGTAIGKPCADVSVVLPDVGHLPPFGCPVGPLGLLSAIDVDKDAISLQVSTVVLRAPSPFTFKRPRRRDPAARGDNVQWR